MFKSCCLVFLALGALVFPAEGTALGAVKLDNYTFNKALGVPGHTWLVKFDKTYAYGEKEDEYKLLAKLAHTIPQFFVAEVGVGEYGEKENDDLRQEFNLNKDDFPIYLLFNEANKRGLRYSGDIKADLLAGWLRGHGVKMPAIGTIEELDTIAKKFMKEGMKDAEIAEAKKLAEGEFKEDRKAAMYVKIMEKIKEKGAGYTETETKRIGTILSGTVTDTKKAEMTDKLKILAVFSEK